MAEKINKILNYFRSDRFNLISWGVTACIVVVALVSTALWLIQKGSAAPDAQPQTTTAASLTPIPAGPPPVTLAMLFNGIGRQLELKTNMPADRPNVEPVDYTVVRGDSMFGIAKQFNIKPESILFSNKDVLQDNPENLKPGMDLVIPPTDGLLYTWKPGDTIQKVADEFKAKPDDILNWPGNNIDLTNPEIKSGTEIMIPGGQRELVDWTQFIPTISRGATGAGTGTSNIGTHQCGGGPSGIPSVWPVLGEPHTVSGNDFGPTHLGIDITGHLGDTVVAAGSGVVVLAQGGYNYGYGNFIEIDHGNGYATVYAHLSQINVTVCQGVYAGQAIGLVGSTGNSTGAHLHFEVRKGGSNIDPWNVVQ